MKHISADMLKPAPDHFRIDSDYVMIVAQYESRESRELKIQDFTIENKDYIPIFTDWNTFDRCMKGTGFEERGIEIKRDFLFSILTGEEELLLNLREGGTLILYRENLK